MIHLHPEPFQAIHDLRYGNQWLHEKYETRSLLPVLNHVSVKERAEQEHTGLFLRAGRGTGDPVTEEDIPVFIKQFSPFKDRVSGHSLADKSVFLKDSH